MLQSGASLGSGEGGEGEEGDVQIVGIPVAAGGLGEGAAGTERVGGEEVGVPSVGDEVESRHAGGVVESHFRSDPGTSVGNVGEVDAAHEQETEAHEQKPSAKGCRPTAGEGDARKEEQVGKADGKEGGMDRQHTAGQRLQQAKPTFHRPQNTGKKRRQEGAGKRQKKKKQTARKQ